MRRCGIAGCAEVDELDLAVCRNKNIVGCDIAVDYPVFMHLIERFDDRYHHLHRLVLGEAFVALQDIGKRFAFKKLHYDISRVVRFDAVEYLDDARQRMIFRELFGFFGEFAQTVGKLLLLVASEHRDLGLTHNAGRKLTRKIFLYRDFCFKQAVPPDVRNAEPAVAYHLSYYISVNEYRPGRHMKGVFLNRPFLMTAVRTHDKFVMILLHTPQASLHSSTFLFSKIFSDRSADRRSCGVDA